MGEALAVKPLGLPILASAMIVGNGMLIFVFFRYKSLRTVTNCFVLNLALSDLTVGLIIVPLLESAELGLFGYTPRLCLAISCCTLSQLLISILALLAVTVERYLAILKPLRHHTVLTTNIAWVASGCLWIYALALGFSPMYDWSYVMSATYNASVLKEVHSLDGTMNQNPIFSNHTDTQPSRYNDEHCRIQNVVPGTYMGLLFLGHYLPSWVIMVFIYVRIYITVARQAKSERTQRLSSQRRHAYTNIKALRILVILVGYFLLSWLPVIIYYGSLYNGFTQDYALKKSPIFPLWFYDVSVTLAYGNSAVDPFLYGLGNRSIRKAWKETLSKCPCLHFGRKHKERDATHSVDHVGSNHLLSVYSNGAANGHDGEDR